MATTAAFLADVLQNRHNRTILARLPKLGAPGARLVAGCLFQTVWNLQSQQEPTASIKDYDLFYFDGSDLSWEAEDQVIRRANALFADLPVTVEVRNQARVHLWYPERFGSDYPQLHRCEDGIDRFLIRGTCVGIDADQQVYAPFGLDELYQGRLVRNTLLPDSSFPRFQAKAASYIERWPWLKVVEENSPQS
ncbi:nucleotidyltransferase family protein [Chitinimonas lacunae]|uniref:Nucleotidyltransferase family protein n=1 Tax=Chitinimonas lacunae TaxID=1963018 RepID=A0ABV8MJU4_9NEIS